MEKRKRKISRVVRFTENEFEQVKAKAKTANMKLETYMRWIACEGELKIYDVKPINDLVVQISKIGTNINQIAAMINKTQTVYVNDIESLQGQLDDIEKYIDTFITIFERTNKENQE